ncbi:hypothetical protein FLONG3_630 [Fusarium longipes]|uniref:Copper-fist domain-containing protein n=1 Tax=Fusarium longipes TaxID=694270 RepID=A0A395T974_9HYPO|nr:hypothetical protein FLONG3_630 [Fusarium longipes]
MTKVNKDADGNTIYRKDNLGRKIACARCVNGHRSSNCKDWHTEGVRVIDGVGRKRGSKNVPKDAPGPTRREKKDAHRRANPVPRAPVQNQLPQTTVEAQPANLQVPTWYGQAGMDPGVNPGMYGYLNASPVFDIPHNVVEAIPQTLVAPTVPALQHPDHFLAGDQLSVTLPEDIQLPMEANYGVWPLGFVAGVRPASQNQSQYDDFW